MGNQVTKYPVRSAKFKEKGRSTLAGRKLWFDDVYGRLNNEGKGAYLGSFEEEKYSLFIATATTSCAIQSLHSVLKRKKYY